MLFFQVIGLAAGFPLLAFTFGWAVLGWFGTLDRQERFAAAFGVGFAFCAAAQFLAFLTKAPQPLFSWVIVGVMAATTALGPLTRPAPGEKPSERRVAPLAGWWALGYLHLLCIQALLPCYLGSNWWGDWHHHFLAARVFLGELPIDTEWGGAGTYTVASRTPLFNLATTFPLNLTGTQFWAFQAASAAPSFAFAAAAFLLLRNLFGPRAALLGLLLAPLNLWMLHNAWFTWPKMLAAYYLLLGLHFYLQMVRQRRADPAAARGYFRAFWLAFLLGYLAHQVAVIYLAMLLVHAAVMCFRERAGRPGVRSAAFLVGSAACLLGPWYGWLLSQFGWSRVTGGTPVTQMDQQATGLWYVIGSFGSNLGASLVPVTLVRLLWEPGRDAGEFYRGLTELYFSLLPGALTVSLTLFLLCRLFAALRQGGARDLLASLGTPEKTAVVAFAALAPLAAAFLHPLRVNHGIAHAVLFPSVVLLAVLAWGVLARAPRAVAAVVCLGMVAEFLTMFWSHLRLLEDPLLLDPYDFNLEAKRNGGLAFLSDVLGSSAGPFAATLIVQAVLCAALACRVWQSGGKDSEPPRSRPDLTSS